MEKVEHPIIILTDPSFNHSYGLKVAMDEILKTIKQNPLEHYIFGIVPRIDWHVFEYAKTFRIPFDNLHHLEIDMEKIDVQEVSKILARLADTMPKKAIVFRDNPVSDVTGEFIDECVARGIEVLDIDSHNNRKLRSPHTQDDDRPNYYYVENPLHEPWSYVPKEI